MQQRVLKKTWLKPSPFKNAVFGTGSCSEKPELMFFFLGLLIDLQKVQNCGCVCLVSWKFDIETVNELLVALHGQNPLPRTALKLGWLGFWGDSEKSELSAVEPRL